MRKLILFLVRYKTAILFIILQVAAFIFIYQSLSYQRSTIYTLHAEWSGRVLSTYNNINDYLNLARTNRNLARDNANLKSNAKQNYFALFATRDTLTDSLYIPQYTYLEARVINSSFSKLNNYITLNRGAVHGVKPDMAVTSAMGVVGLIKDVSAHFSTVIPLINGRNLMSVRFLKNGYFGSLSWKGGDYRFALLSDVPREAPVQIGDSIITDYRSKSFPTDLLIGTVENFTLNQENMSYNIIVKLSTDFASLDYVYIIENLLKNEQNQLEAKLER